MDQEQLLQAIETSAAALGERKHTGEEADIVGKMVAEATTAATLGGENGVRAMQERGAKPWVSKLASAA